MEIGGKKFQNCLILTNSLHNIERYVTTGILINTSNSNFSGAKDSQHFNISQNWYDLNKELIHYAGSWFTLRKCTTSCKTDFFKLLFKAKNQSENA